MLSTYKANYNTNLHWESNTGLADAFAMLTSPLSGFEGEF
jgi:hypothetical protein